MKANLAAFHVFWRGRRTATSPPFEKVRATHVFEAASGGEQGGGAAYLPAEAWHCVARPSVEEHERAAQRRGPNLRPCPRPERPTRWQSQYMTGSNCAGSSFLSICMNASCPLEAAEAEIGSNPAILISHLAGIRPKLMPAGPESCLNHTDNPPQHEIRRLSLVFKFMPEGCSTDLETAGCASVGTSVAPSPRSHAISRITRSLLNTACSSPKSRWRGRKPRILLSRPDAGQSPQLIRANSDSRCLPRSPPGAAFATP